MPTTIVKLTALVCSLMVLFITVPGPTAEAGFFDRIKDIYNTPEKISELEQQYLEAKEALAEQQEQLAESVQAAEEYAQKQQELLEQNEQFRQQNEQLIAQNTSLQTEMAQMQQQKKSFVRKLINTVIIFAAFIAAYIVSVRVWRYATWRKQRKASRRGIRG